MPDQPAIGIIGAGIAGLTCARELAAGGLEPVVFKKAAPVLAGIRYAICHTLMVTTHNSPESLPDRHYPEQGPFSLITRDNSKPAARPFPAGWRTPRPSGAKPTWKSTTPR